MNPRTTMPLRPSGCYARVDGEWFASNRPLPGAEAVLSLQTDEAPPIGFRPGAVAGFFTRRVRQSELDELVEVIVTVAVDGLRPFQLTGVRGLVADVLYRGDDTSAAEALEGLRAGDAYQDGGDIRGTVELGRISDADEDVTSLEIFR